MRRREFMSTLGALAAAQSGSSNPKIQAGREAALALLKPSKRDLEHGLELHGSSLVIEPYGFSPRPAVDGARIAKAIADGASDLEIQDLTEESSMINQVGNAAEREEYRQAWDASGVTCIGQNAGEEGSDPLRLMKRLARFTYVTDTLKDIVARASTPADIESSYKSGKHCLYFTGNGVPLVQQWVSVEDELRYIRVFFQLGVRMMHLTYNRRNPIGDGVGEPGNGGLSDFGHAVVAEMNRVGLIVDVAHSGWRTSLEAAKASKVPMVASHTTAAAVHRHVRSKPDEVIRAVCDSGGYVGICAIPAFLGRTGDIVAMLDHIDYVAKKFGADHLAIATDLGYSSRNSAAENQKIPPRRGRRRAAWEALWPADAFAGYPSTHPSTAWTNWPLFTVGLVQRGHKDDDIRKILGLNALRVLKAVWEARTP
jgi:membrane dipeptidase